MIDVKKSGFKIVTPSDDFFLGDSKIVFILTLTLTLMLILTLIYIFILIFILIESGSTFSDRTRFQTISIFFFDVLSKL